MVRTYFHINDQKLVYCYFGGVRMSIYNYFAPIRGAEVLC